MATSLQPPDYILQNWRRDQIDSHDKYLLQQRFIMAPDGTIPFSKLRQHIRKIYGERTKPLVVVHYDPWEKRPTQISTLITQSKDLVKSHSTL